MQVGIVVTIGTKLVNCSKEAETYKEGNGGGNKNRGDNLHNEQEQTSW